MGHFLVINAVFDRHLIAGRSAGMAGLVPWAFWPSCKLRTMSRSHLLEPPTAAGVNGRACKTDPRSGACMGSRFPFDTQSNFRSFLEMNLVVRVCVLSVNAEMLFVFHNTVSGYLVLIRSGIVPAIDIFMSTREPRVRTRTSNGILAGAPRFRTC